MRRHVNGLDEKSASKNKRKKKLYIIYKAFPYTQAQFLKSSHSQMKIHSLFNCFHVLSECFDLTKMRCHDMGMWKALSVDASCFLSFRTKDDGCLQKTRDSMGSELVFSFYRTLLCIGLFYNWLMVRFDLDFGNLTEL